VGLSRYLWNSERRFQGLLSLFDSLKAPIVVSDIDGRIEFANQACCQLVGVDLQELQKKDFFQVFAVSGELGKYIDRYLALFGTGPNEGAELEINLGSKGSERIYHATCSLIVEGKRKLLVSQIG
jgi:PAS domain S-box-containing protein